MSEVFIVIIVVRGIFERERSRSKRPMITQDAVDSVVLDGIQTRINYLSNPEEVKSLFKEYLGECFNVESMSMPEIDKEIAEYSYQSDSSKGKIENQATEMALMVEKLAILQNQEK